MTIQVNFPAGTNIKDAAFQAIELAKMLSQHIPEYTTEQMQIGIEFNFNDIKCSAYSHNSVEQIVEHYEKDRR